MDGPVAIIGGGNTAVDVARSVARLGGEPWIVYRRRRRDMPAFETEVLMALEEGVKIRELLAPVRLERTGGRLALTVQPMRVDGTDSDGRSRVVPDGAEETLEFARVFKAIGEEAAEDWHRPPGKGGPVLALSNSTIIVGDGSPVLIYGGDLAASVKSVVHAVASAKEGAMALDLLLRGDRKISPAASKNSGWGTGLPCPWRSTRAAPGPREADTWSATGKSTPTISSSPRESPSPAFSPTKGSADLRKSI